MGNLPYSLYKVCCLQILKQYFDCVLCNASTGLEPTTSCVEIRIYKNVQW